PVCAAAGLAVLETIEREDLASGAERKGQFLREGLKNLAARHTLIGDIRGRGLASGVELVRDQHARIPARAETAKLIYRLYELGAVLYHVGMNGNVLEFTPPLTITEGELHRALALLDQALT